MPKPVKNFFKGLITRFEPQSIPDGAASKSLNWRTKGDKIELRRGMKLLGQELAGNGGSYVHVAQRADGGEILFRKRGRKLEYYDAKLLFDWVECGSDIFPAAAENDEPSFANYNSLAGAQLFITSPNSSVYKVMVANPDSVTDLQMTTFRGRIRIKNGRTLLWGRKDANGSQDLTGLYGSYLDKDEMSDYTTITAEAIGALGAAHYAGTLAFKGAEAKRTCFGVLFTDGNETFTDDYHGALVGSKGGSGTINYSTGAYDINFAAATTGNVTATYYWENSTDKGIFDFTKATPRVAGEGFIMRQDDGGGQLQNVMSYRTVHYCLHRQKTWALSIDATDSSATNFPYREHVGIPSAQAAVESGDGIYYIDDIDQTDPRIRLLTLDAASSEVIPRPISDNLDFSNYRFDRAVMLEWGNYLLVACRTSESEVNNRLLAYEKNLKSWDEFDYYCASLAIYEGTLIGGDSISPNAYVLFSGYDNDETTIPNAWEGNLSDLTIEGLKKSHRFKIQGEIQPDQKIDISMSVDTGPFVKIGTVSGNAPYVDSGQSVAVGAVTIGRLAIGGGSDGNIEAYNYETEFRLMLDTFEQIKVRFEAKGLGYASVSLYEFRDVRYKGRKVPNKYKQQSV